jgi:cytochrome c5
MAVREVWRIAQFRARRALAGPPPVAVSPPAGAGKEQVEGSCALCHGLDRIVAANCRKSEWDGIVARIIFLGAPLAPEQATTIAAYLDSKFGAD